MDEQNLFGEKLDKIRRMVPAPALYEAIAEEAAELSHAALKRARILRGENPTPADEIEVVKNFKEEVNDVILMMNVLGLSNDDELMLAKMDRWIRRLSENGGFAPKTEERMDNEEMPQPDLIQPDILVDGTGNE